MDDLYECYRVLDLVPGASADQVKQAWRDLTKVWHPDRFQADPRLRDKAEERLKAINLAYARLRHAQTRSDELSPAAGRSPSPPEGWARAEAPAWASRSSVRPRPYRARRARALVDLAMLWAGLFFGVFAFTALAHAAQARSPRRALIGLITWLNPLNGDRLLFNLLSLGPAVALVILASRAQGRSSAGPQNDLRYGWLWIGLLLVFAAGTLVLVLRRIL